MRTGSNHATFNRTYTPWIWCGCCTVYTYGHHDRVWHIAKKFSERRTISIWWILVLFFYGLYFSLYATFQIRHWAPLCYRCYDRVCRVFYIAWSKLDKVEQLSLNFQYCHSCYTYCKYPLRTVREARGGNHYWKCVYRKYFPISAFSRKLNFWQFRVILTIWNIIICT